MDSFVFTRHTSKCKYKRDRLYRRCNCPKWVEARFNSERVRKSSSTRLWDKAEQFRQKLEETLASGRPLSTLDSDLIRADDVPLSAPSQSAPEMVGVAVIPSSTQLESAQSPDAPHGEILSPGRQRARVTIQKAVEVYMADARSRNLQTDTVKKLERLFEKQFLPWTKSEGLVYLDELDHNALLTYRTTWTEGMVVKAKKQDRVVGFFWESFRRGFITQNPALSLSKIRPKHIPTDYFPRDAFDRIIDAIVIYGDPRGGYGCGREDSPGRGSRQNEDTGEERDDRDCRDD
jgi:integrase/recombinase XerD